MSMTFLLFFLMYFGPWHNEKTVRTLQIETESAGDSLRTDSVIFFSLRAGYARIASADTRRSRQVRAGHDPTGLSSSFRTS